MKHFKSRFIRKKPLIKKTLRLPLLVITILTALTFVIFLSHATWFPGLLQIVADNFDPNRFHETADQEYADMFTNSRFCTKHSDCEIVCRPNQFVTDCNSYAKNTFNENLQACTEISCRQELFTYAVCEESKCKVKGF